MAQYGFGFGVLALTNTTDSATTRDTPLVVGVLQDVSLDISMTTKELRGAFQFPVDIARGSASISGKAKSGQLGSQTIAAIVGASAVAGAKIGTINLSRTPTANALTLAAADMGGTGYTFFESISVVKQSDGSLMTRMADATLQATLTAGQYTVSTAGVYSFSTTDANPPVYLTFTSQHATTGKTVGLVNALMGAGVTFKLDLHNNFRSKNYGWRLPAVTIPKLSFAPKQDDYTTVDMEFSAFADSAGKVLEYFGTE